MSVLRGILNNEENNEEGLGLLCKGKLERRRDRRVPAQLCKTRGKSIANSSRKMTIAIGRGNVSGAKFAWATLRLTCRHLVFETFSDVTQDVSQELARVKRHDE